MTEKKKRVILRKGGGNYGAAAGEWYCFWIRSIVRAACLLPRTNVLNANEEVRYIATVGVTLCAKTRWHPLRYQKTRREKKRTHEVGVGKQVHEHAIIAVSERRQKHLHEHREFLCTACFVSNAFHV